MNITINLTDDQNSNLKIFANELRLPSDLTVGSYTLHIDIANADGWSEMFSLPIDVQDPIPAWVPRDGSGC